MSLTKTSYSAGGFSRGASNVMGKRKVPGIETVVTSDGEFQQVEGEREEVATKNGPKLRKKKEPKDADLLTAREVAFVGTIVQKLIAGAPGAVGDAARAAGYAPQRSYGLLQKPAVRRAVDIKLTEALDKVDAETSWLLERLAQVIDFDPRLVTENIEDLDDATAMAIEGIDTQFLYEDKKETGTVKKYKAASKLAAIRLFLEFKRLVGGDRVKAGGQRDRLEEIVKATTDV